MSNVNKPTILQLSKILIADPNEHFTRSLASLLTQRGIRSIHFACTGRDAISTAVKLKPDLILLDRSIQTMDSFATLSNLKYLLPDTPVIMLVTFVDTSSLTRARELGIDGFYSKSIEPEALVQAIISLLEDISTEDTGQVNSFSITSPFLDLNSKTKRLNTQQD